MYSILAYSSIALTFVLAFIMADSYKNDCQAQDFYGGIYILLLFSFPNLFWYLEEINKSQAERLVDLERAEKLRWLFRRGYGLKKNPWVHLLISAFFGVLAISGMFSKECR